MRRQLDLASAREGGEQLGHAPAHRVRHREHLGLPNPAAAVELSLVLVKHGAKLAELDLELGDRLLLLVVLIDGRAIDRGLCELRLHRLPLVVDRVHVIGHRVPRGARGRVGRRVVGRLGLQTRAQLRRGDEEALHLGRKGLLPPAELAHNLARGVARRVVRRHRVLEGSDRVGGVRVADRGRAELEHARLARLRCLRELGRLVRGHLVRLGEVGAQPGPAFLQLRRVRLALPLLELELELGDAVARGLCGAHRVDDALLLG
mmetsp:Transcript_20972/g.54095  ORF Transcript_20972/g.54095 Transcript_20972/m.54095 type:complete len:262 (+) Transcript_20972:776-1561(+)